ncbi:MAG: hypothetical protein QF548_12240, partial [Acidimicrobiales bacterium]|nr:hypothetical protein [Acidimicrobiales bacterium]
IPPFIGFYAKWIILSELINSDMLSIALIGIIVSVIAAFYYLRIVWYMYFEEPLTSNSLNVSKDVKVIMSVNGLIILLLGVFPGWLMQLCDSVFG